ILSSVEAYDPSTDTWVDVAPMPTARMGLAATVAGDGTIYALGGTNQGHTWLDTAEAYNPHKGTWGIVAPMPTGRRDLAAASSIVQGVGYIFAIGGHRGTDFNLATV